MGYIYVITNKVNGKQYVGQTSSFIEERWKQHIKSKDESYFHRALRKYGIDNFSIEQIEECSSIEVDNREKYWIEKLDTYNNGYNSTLGGEGLCKHNYKEIANKYAELLSVKQTAELFGCDLKVVRRACAANNIKIQSTTGKKKTVAKIDIETNKIIEIYDSVSNAARALGNINYRQAIGRACNGGRPTAYGYKWMYV